MELKSQSLQPYNTFGIDVLAEQLIAIKNQEQILSFIQNNGAHQFKIIGGGSNLLLTKNIKEPVLRNEIKGIHIMLENEREVLLKIGGGEIWHDLVIWAVQRNYGGIENLSLIPGTVGAAPIQNIGAYGVELKDVFEGVDFVHFDQNKIVSFNKEECQFGYRDSIFKRQLKNKFFITHVYLKLSKPPHVTNISYGIIKNTLSKKGIITPNLKNISDTIIEIRNQKLPDPKEIGNSGSFFKNPIISNVDFENLLQKFPSIAHYKLPDGHVKIPAAWLIDYCQFKGVRYGNTGCYKYQPLVIINYGNATGLEIKKHAERVQKKVYSTFEINIQPEVNIW